MNQASTPNSTAEFFEDFEELDVSTELAEFQNGYFTDQDCSSRQFVRVIFPCTSQDTLHVSLKLEAHSSLHILSDDCLFGLKPPLKLQKQVG